MIIGAINSWVSLFLFRLPNFVKRDETDMEGEFEIEDIPLVIHTWCSSRTSLSTGLIYSFGKRTDTEVLDEPLHMQYHQGSDNGIDTVNKIYGPSVKKFRFCKHLANQKFHGLPREILEKGKHILLISNPLYVLPFLEFGSTPSLISELGYFNMVSIRGDLLSMGDQPLVVDSSDLEKEPQGTLRLICEYVGVPFDVEMLSWSIGEKEFEGPWAAQCYLDAQDSRNFTFS